MQPYTGFASVYDIFMDNIPYDEWAEYIEHLLKKSNIKDGLILELGCGTGSITARLAEKGYDMIGIDASEDMLAIARENSEVSNNKILYLCQDMRDFELYGTVAAVISVCDSMNYITTEEDLSMVFRLVNNYLDPGGLFLFDLDTQYAYEEVLGDSTIAENREEGSFIWENTYYPEEMINEINLTLFIPQEALFQKHEETHYRRAYAIDTIKRLIEEAGMEWIAVYDTLTEKRPKKDSERVYILAREKHQQGKTYL
jgi:SAM-dependent methyltransferase